MSSDFALSDRIDWDGIARRFAAHGRIEIPCLLAGGQAATLRENLAVRTDWTLVMNAGANVYEMTRDAWATLDGAQRAELDRRIVAAGRDGFQYRYEAIRAPDGGDAASHDPVARFVAFLSSPTVLGTIGDAMGVGDLAFADGQATRYDAGHFLTRHDDDVDGKHRRAAYVFSLAPRWRAEWGGLLMFHGEDGNIDEAFVPRMGALRLFAVPQPHSVSYVTPLAPEARLSITGWLRAAG
jgi:hypothetical protein